MKTVVITGSTRGIGFTLSQAFLSRDCQVVISGRSNSSVQSSMDALSKDYPAEHIAGFACDVTQYEQVKALWEKAHARFGGIDIWINNAGISNEQNPPWKIPPEEMKAVIETNILGEMYGTHVAMQGFLNQGFGALYNVEGYGANGKMNNVQGLSVYGATKAGLHFFNQCVAREVDQPNIITGALQPGMVLTDMVRGQYEGKPEEWNKVKGILTIIANPVEEVAAWLSEKVLSNQKNNAYFKYGSTFFILWKMMLSLFRKNENE